MAIKDSRYPISIPPADKLRNYTTTDSHPSECSCGYWRFQATMKMLPSVPYSVSWVWTHDWYCYTIRGSYMLLC